ncbi:MAG: tRNA (N(6)-L-threonylcarbamoyladenosine(37)-C(2))-methylthiotransferase [archaeon]
MKLLIKTFGCSLNQSDSEQLKGFLKSFNVLFTSDLNKANTVIINSCGVKEQTETNVLRLLRKLEKERKKRKFKLIVTGCLPAINNKAIMEVSKSILLFGAGPKEFKKIAKKLKLKEKKLSFKPVKQNKFIGILPAGNGCLGECSYCATKHARGTLKSVPIKELVKRFKFLVKDSKEIWLTAQDLSAYGKDLNTNLLELLKALLQVKGNYRVRLGMMNASHLKKYLNKLLELMKKDERTYKFFHLPLQSGSDKILKQMNRTYKVKEFLETVKKARKEIPDITISTDIIVGFPGESEKDFQETLKVVKQVKPGTINISRYGKRLNTLASEMQGQLHGRDKKERSRKLTKLSREIKLKENQKLVGKKFEVLFTEKGTKEGFVGRTKNYKTVVVKENVLGETRKVLITKASENFLKGKIVY